MLEASQAAQAICFLEEVLGGGRVVNDNKDAQRIGAKERRALASIILYKASTLRTTEAWVKESAEIFLGVNDLNRIAVKDYEDALSYLIEFNE